MAKRKTNLDKAIDTIDQKIADARDTIKALELARAHLVEQQQHDQRGHTEGGHGV